MRRRYRRLNSPRVMERGHGNASTHGHFFSVFIQTGRAFHAPSGAIRMRESSSRSENRSQVSSRWRVIVTTLGSSHLKKRPVKRAVQSHVGTWKHCFSSHPPNTFREIPAEKNRLKQTGVIEQHPAKDPEGNSGYRRSTFTSKERKPSRHLNQ